MTMSGIRSPVIIAPFANERIKEWPLSYYRALSEIIWAEHGRRVLVVGTRAHWSAGNDLVRGLSTLQITNSCGFLSWPELLCAVDAAPYVVANNSALAHVAASRERWTLCLYAGSHRYNEWIPRGRRVVVLSAMVPCAPCGIGDGLCPNNVACMQELAPERVFRLFSEIRGDLSA
jgi:ADP-heptose:LPS heptosyltransferase